LVPASSLLDLYDGTLYKVFVKAIPVAGLAFVAILGVEWKSVHERRRGAENQEEEVGGEKARAQDIS
jgi:hypothetical protein